jgi:hypothetical protein
MHARDVEDWQNGNELEFSEMLDDVGLADLIGYNHHQRQYQPGGLAAM